MAITPIRIHQDPGAVVIHRPTPRVQVESSDAQMSVSRRSPQVSVDRSDYREAVGVRLPVELGSHLYGKAAQATSEAISRIVAEGDQFGAIENKEGSSIAAVSEGEMPTDEAEVTLQSVPAPVFTVIPGGIDVRITPGELRISIPAAPVQIDVRRAQVTVDKEVQPLINRTA